jgi:hypothetical protein
VDVVLVDVSTGLVLRRWHEGGDEAAGLLSVLTDDLMALTPEQFIEKWDFPAT